MYTVYGLKHVYSVQHIVYIINTVNIIHSVFGVKHTVYMLYILHIMYKVCTVVYTTGYAGWCWWAIYLNTEYYYTVYTLNSIPAGLEGESCVYIWLLNTDMWTW